MTEETRGSRGGNARKEKLSPERRKEIAQEAAKKRWAIKKGVTAEEAKSLPGATIVGVTIEDGKLLPTVDVKYESTASPDPKEKHCQACLDGQSLEEGEGTHILGTAEHPITLPATFDDGKMQDVSVAPPQVPQKPAKAKSKAVPKEFRTASSYAEKRLPQAIKEKAEHVAKVAQLDAEINDLVRVIKALGGTVEGQGQQTAQQYQPYPLPAPYPEYQQPAQSFQTLAPQPPQGIAPQVQMPKPMRAGGAGALDFSGIINDV